MKNFAMKRSNDSESQDPTIPIAELKNHGREELPYKLGNLFYEFIAGTTLQVLGYRAEHVAEFLEQSGYIQVTVITGKPYYRWATGGRLSKSAFLDMVLPPVPSEK